MSAQNREHGPQSTKANAVHRFFAWDFRKFPPSIYLHLQQGGVNGHLQGSNTFLSLIIFCKMGREYAAVFPVPVLQTKKGVVTELQKGAMKTQNFTSHSECSQQFAIDAWHIQHTLREPKGPFL